MVCVSDKSGAGVASEHHQNPNIGLCKGLKKAKEIPGPVSARSAQKTRTATKNILLVDDEIMIAKMAKKALTQLGYTVTALTDAHEALHVFATKPSDFDVVITDQNMPEITGASLARQLIEIRPDIPIVLATGYTDSSDAKSDKFKGIRAFAKKPIGIHALVGLIEEVSSSESNKTTRVELPY